MPRALSQMGILLGTIVIIWSGLCAAFGLYLQTRCARYLERGSASFFALSQLTYPNAAVVFDAAIAIKCFGVGVSYLIIIGDLMPGVVLGFQESAGEVGYLVDRHFWITAFMYVLLKNFDMEEVGLTCWQAHCYTPLLSATPGLAQIYLCDCACGNWLSHNTRLSTLYQGRHARGQRGSSRFHLARTRSGTGELPGHCICIHMSPECILNSYSLSRRKANVMTADVLHPQRNS